MKRNFVVILISLLISNYSQAQDDDKILLIVNDNPIMVSEFLRVYNKNLDLVKDDSQKDIDGYLELFVNYQLKLAEAKELKFDENPKYQNEFQSYKRQLTRNYLSESKVTEALIYEAYERMNSDIKASHILVALDENAKDTVKVYNQLLKLRDRVLKEGYSKVQQEVHNGKTIYAEDLGYFSAFKMVYDFETAAYATEVNEVSMPFRTPYGYHIVNIFDKRPSKGTATAAHIMIALEQKDSTLNPEVRINEIYKKLNQGESFEALAKQFSDDKGSARKGGELAPFKSGQLSSEIFENKTFQLQNKGDISQPFKSEYGWHIVKLINKMPIKSLEELKPELENRIKRDTRSKLINSAMVSELEQRYTIAIVPEAKAYFNSLLSDSYFNRSWMLPDDLIKSEIIFSINDSNYTYEMFAKHLQSAQGSYLGKALPFSIVVDKEFDTFYEKSILQYREENLENENEEFANILKEYRDGLLLFDLMEKEIWNKASKDSLGLRTFYEANKSNYQWDRRVEALISSSASEAYTKKALQQLKKGKSPDDISKALNTNNEQNVIFSSGIYRIQDERLPSDLVVKKGISKIHYHNESYQVIDIKSILPAGVKTFEEARGNVINDFQNEIELKWLAGLEEKYPVDINKDVLQTIKLKLKN